MAKNLWLFTFLFLCSCSGAKPIAPQSDAPAASAASGNQNRSLTKLPRLVLKFAVLKPVAGVKLIPAPNPAVYGPNGEYPVITLRWNVPDSTTIEIHMKSADGVVFAAGGSFGSATTGPWVQPGALFYLQDVTNGEPGITKAILKTVLCKTCKV